MLHPYDGGVTRRDVVKAGLLGGCGLNLASLLRLEAAGQTATRGKNAIFVFLTGGQSHIDTWDLKPQAGAMRGEFKSIATTVGNLRVCEHMPYLAQQAKRYTAVRSIHHAQAAHSPGQRYLQTGNLKIPSQEFPDYGAVISKKHRAPKGVPPYVLLPGGGSNSAIYSAGYLGVAYGPFTALGDPNAKEYSVRALASPAGLTLDQVRSRQRLLRKVDTRFRDADLASQELKGFDQSYQQAFDILQSTRVRKAFDISREPAKIRAHYGRNSFGQSCLLARRLVEAGTRCVSIYTGGWDTHQFNFRDLKSKLLPPWDQGLASLIEDLSNRRLLDDTVVWCTGEFGRTPKINDRGAGRDHWSRAMSMLFAGGGIKGGQVIGKTDKTASEPVTDPYSPADAAASFYKALGIDSQAEFHTPDGRPIQIVKGGTPITELFA